MYGVLWRVETAELPNLAVWAMASTPTSPLAKKLVSVVDDEGTTYEALTFYVVRKSKGAIQKMPGAAGSGKRLSTVLVLGVGLVVSFLS